MKKKHLLQKSLLGFALVYCQSGSAAEKSHVALGLQGGLNFATISAPSQISSSSRTGFIGGVNLNIPLGRVISLQPEFLYVQRGATLVDDFGIKGTLNSDSVELPLLVKASIGEGIRPYVFAGPVAILNVANRLQVSGGSHSGTFSYKPRTFDVAADIGVGLDVGPLFGNIRYSLGLLDVNEDHTDWKSRGIQALIGFYL